MRRKQHSGKKIIKSILFWVPFVSYLAFIEPSSVVSFIGFYALLSLALFFTLRSFFSLGRTIVWVGITITYLLLRQFRLDNLIDTLLLGGLLITFELLFRRG